MTSQRRKLFIPVLILLSLIVAGIVVYGLVRNRNNSVVDMAAGQGDRPVIVDVWIDGDLRFHNTAGGDIPEVRLAPGKHVIKMEAPEYFPYEETIQAKPEGGAFYIYGEMRLKNPKGKYSDLNM